MVSKRLNIKPTFMCPSLLEPILVTYPESSAEATSFSGSTKPTLGSAAYALSDQAHPRFSDVYEFDREKQRQWQETVSRHVEELRSASPDGSSSPAQWIASSTGSSFSPQRLVWLFRLTSWCSQRADPTPVASKVVYHGFWRGWL